MCPYILEEYNLEISHELSSTVAPQWNQKTYIHRERDRWGTLIINQFIKLRYLLFSPIGEIIPM